MKIIIIEQELSANSTGLLLESPFNDFDVIIVLNVNPSVLTDDFESPLRCSLKSDLQYEWSIGRQKLKNRFLSFVAHLCRQEVKSKLSLFERPFKGKKNGVFFFVTSSFFL